MKIHVVYILPLILNITDVIKICNGLSHYFLKKNQRKNSKVKQKKLFLNDGVIKNNVDLIILIP